MREGGSAGSASVGGVFAGQGAGVLGHERAAHQTERNMRLRLDQWPMAAAKAVSSFARSAGETSWAPARSSPSRPFTSASWKGSFVFQLTASC